MADYPPPPESWTPVSSSNVDAIRHDGDRTMYVRFRDGSIYAWEGPPPDVFYNMLNAPSAGKYVHWVLEGAYGKGVRV